MKRGQIINALVSYARVFRTTKLFDFLAAMPLAIWYGFGASQLFPVVRQQTTLAIMIARTDIRALDSILVLSIIAKIVSLVFLASLAVLFVVRRKPREKASGLYPRLVALAGTAISPAILLFPARELSATIYLISLLLIVSGMTFATCALVELGRSISILPEARGLATRGPYTLIRHPLYLAEMVAIAGVTLQYLSPGALSIFAALCFLQVERLRNEERVLSKAFPEYREYMKCTARLMPGLY